MDRAPIRKDIESRIYMIRGQSVMLDADLADLYGVTTGNLNKAVSRNPLRFPGDFMFQLSVQEFKDLKFQSGISSWGGRRKPPYAFTEQGVAMLSSVLQSDRAADINVQIVRTFVRLREMALDHESFRRKLRTLERTLAEKSEEDEAKFRAVFQAIESLMAPPPASKKRRIGF